MSSERSRLSLVFRPTPAEKELSFFLRARFAMMGANGLEPVSAETTPALHGLLEAVSESAGMHAPRAFIWSSKKPVANAVAMPSNPPIVAFSKTITEILNPEELAAVAGHELGHVKNTRHSGKLFWLSAIGGATLAHFAAKPFQNRINEDMAAGRGTPLHVAADSALFAAKVIAPVAAGALATRSEEYAADRHGALTMGGDATPLVSALAKLDQHNRGGGGDGGKSVLKPILDATRSHPKFDERRRALGVSRDEVAQYQQQEEAPQSQQQKPRWRERTGTKEERERAAEPPQQTR